MAPVMQAGKIDPAFELPAYQPMQGEKPFAIPFKENFQQL
jgi:hypothetical protein